MLLIIFHSAMPFVSFGWEVKNEVHSEGLSSLIIWMHQWRLPLLFFISGVGVSLSLRRRSVAAFFGERLVRLFVPLVFAMFFTIPLQVYFERVQRGLYHGSYTEFYPSVWEMVPYPEGSLTWSHMWFVVYLFVFTILLLPLFALSKFSIFKRGQQFFDRVFRFPVAVMAPASIFIAWYFLLYIEWPEQGSLLDDWFVFVSSITYYFLGFFLRGVGAFWDTCERHRRVFFYIFLASALALCWNFYVPVQLPKAQDSRLYVYGILDGIQIWSIILCAIGYGKRYLNRDWKGLKYLTEAVYPFYILHQTIIVGVAFYVVQWPLPIIVKLLFIVVVCFISLGLIYHFFIRPFQIPRVLFGLHRRSKAKLGVFSESADTRSL